MEIIRVHPSVAFEVLRGIDFPWPIAETVYQHHERLDGSGYPRRLTGGDIIIEARILAVADVVEAITAERPYRKAIGIEAALEEISNQSGARFDPHVVDACVRAFRMDRFSLGEEPLPAASEDA